MKDDVVVNPCGWCGQPDNQKGHSEVCDLSADKERILNSLENLTYSCIEGVDGYDIEAAIQTLEYYGRKIG